MSKIILLPYKPYSPSELAPYFRCCTKTLNRNLAGIKNKLGKRKGHRYSTDQVIMICEHLGGRPEIVVKDDYCEAS